ncbi:MAG: hypothetical protein O3C69_00325 [Chloroflexi bacterium]|nr:hypothetical protein [Chloroflexota bacterium]
MKIFRSSKLAIATVSLAMIGVLAACGGSSASSNTDETVATEAQAAGEEQVLPAAVGAMADASFAVATYMDTIWPIEGNDYADPEAATAWCATYATDPAGATAAVVEYLSVEPDIASADPKSVTTAIDEYLTNNCYLIEE